MNSLHIFSATSKEIEELNSIAWEAKKSWGYPEEWMVLWKNDLRIDTAYVGNHTVLCIEIDGKISGWGSLEFDRKEKRWEIGHLWVHPEVMGQGIGKMLFKDLWQTAKGKGAEELYVLSDPHAKAFYQKMGAHYIEERPAIPQGRTLPLMRVKIDS